MYRKKIKITKKDLYKLYFVEKKSTIFIAQNYNCHHSTICDRLREFKIPIRSKYKIPKKDLVRLYQKKNKSPYFISKLYGCSFSTIQNRLKKYAIPLKSQSLARMKYEKFNFSNNLFEKSYLIGFRLGDLRVHKTAPTAETVVVSLHTTCDVQVDLFKKIFKKYGRVSVCNVKDGTKNVDAYLNRSFEFLLPKADLVEKWIIEKEKRLKAFAAGYIDAEGSFGVYQNRARFKMDSCDKKILFQIHNWLDKNKIINKFFRIQCQGDFLSGYCINKDVYRVNINEANSLLKFIEMIRPFLKHGKRRNDMNKVIKNIRYRKLKGTIK